MAATRAVAGQELKEEGENRNGRLQDNRFAPCWSAIVRQAGLTDIYIGFPA